MLVYPLSQKTGAPVVPIPVSREYAEIDPAVVALSMYISIVELTCGQTLLVLVRVTLKEYIA